MFHVINVLSTKVLSYFYAVCVGKAGFCKHCHVNNLDFFELCGIGTKFYRSKGGLEIAKTRFGDQSSLSQGLVFRELLVR